MLTAVKNRRFMGLPKPFCITAARKPPPHISPLHTTLLNTALYIQKKPVGVTGFLVGVAGGGLEPPTFGL